MSSSSSQTPSIFELFPPHRTPSLTLLLHHLHSAQHPHVVPYLTNLLYSVPLFQIQPYIPQLLNIYLVRGQNETALERFLLDASLSDWMFGMVVYWESVAMSTQSALVGGALGSVNTALGTTSVLPSTSAPGAASTVAVASTSAPPVTMPSSPPLSNSVRMAHLAAAVEKAMLERCIPMQLGGKSGSFNASNSKPHRKVSPSPSSSQFPFIAHRNCFFHDQIYFVDFLTNLTRRLLIYPLGPMRSARLRLELRQFENSGATPHNIFWPLGSSRDIYERIVNVCVDECFALSTKERVPCLIFMEVIRDVSATNAEPPQGGTSVLMAGGNESVERGDGASSGDSSMKLAPSERSPSTAVNGGRKSRSSSFNRGGDSASGSGSSSNTSSTTSTSVPHQKSPLLKSLSDDAITQFYNNEEEYVESDALIVQAHTRSMSMNVEIGGGASRKTSHISHSQSSSSSSSGKSNPSASILSPLMRFPSEQAHFDKMKRIREEKKKTRQENDLTFSSASRTKSATSTPTTAESTSASLSTTHVLKTDDTQNANIRPPLNHTASQTNTEIDPDNMPPKDLAEEHHEQMHAGEGQVKSHVHPHTSYGSGDEEDDDSRIEYLNPPSVTSSHPSTPLQAGCEHDPTTPLSSISDHSALLHAPAPHQIESQIHSAGTSPHPSQSEAFDMQRSAQSHLHSSPPSSPSSPSSSHDNITFSKHYDSDDEFLIVDVPDMRKSLMDEVYGESWEDRRQRIREQSPYGKHAHWDLRSFIVKSNDDIRQEEFCMQLIRLFKKIWVEEKRIPVHVCDYAIFPTSSDSGLIETIRDAVSYDTLIKKFKGYTSLLDYFIAVYGGVESTEFRQAQRNFTESMAAYSVICYLLQIKDRHNGNIMLDREGRVVHIDFGFFLGSSPGNIHFENAPFKMTRAFAEVIAGTRDEPDKSDMYAYFRILVGCCFRAAVENKERIVNLVRSMIPTCFTYPCFEHVSDRNDIIRRLEERFHAHLSDGEIEAFLSKTIDDAYCAQRTKAYDWFQYQTNGLLYEV
uniref:1-phosphatidylinositol 4-kinase n=1 Tax=Percolomonas cosmopolitus TaxID=63605 RepID=A0A7S1KLL4_9EUKA|eukprot:CAMPEP_0117447316 /NCGR_PEP_ID=MMETSP0759-20121206/6809_1 /TAXON_ID=63605 /ORGANISM="Percolomonas cosmopolitus, Strain WS" /LENGTH=1027 /DNA_ID=CAMNT_0005239641 /DNA_START=28 /DNA_END=3111 /DNA_ORIENTATION=+